MKQLQTNFTTYEQSKRLYELRMPSDSADLFMECYWDYKGNSYWRLKHGSHQVFRDKFQMGDGVGAIIPCWSVGRLIEVLKVCIIDKSELEEIFEYLKDCVDTVDTLLQMYKEWKDFIDFSKLDELT